MGKALEIIGLQATAPTQTESAFAAVAGNSLTIRDHRKDAFLLAMLGKRQTGGFLRLTSPLMHDNNVGTALYTPGSNYISQRVFTSQQKLYPQDTIAATGTGSATAGDIESNALVAFYEDLPGVDANLISYAELEKRTVNLLTTVNTLAAGTTGGWTGDEAVNAEEDAFKANTDYALLGIMNATQAAFIRYVGPDWGNLGVGVPGPVSGATNYNGIASERWFVDLALLTGKPCIPVMNASNKGLTTISALTDENGTDPLLWTMWAELK